MWFPKIYNIFWTISHTHTYFPYFIDEELMTFTSSWSLKSLPQECLKRHLQNALNILKLNYEIL